MNGLIRQYIPKKSDFNEFTDLHIKEIENKINYRPRKRYGYENPIFVMKKLLFNTKVAFVALIQNNYKSWKKLNVVYCFS